MNEELLAYWKSDECDGTTLWDCSGHNYNGIIYADWNPGYCLNFDGVDDYVDFDTHSEDLGYNKTDDYTISFNFKSTSKTKGTIYSMSHTNIARAFAQLELLADGRLTYKTGDSTSLLQVNSTGTYNDGSWHYAEVRFYGEVVNPTIEIWVDGSKDGSITDWLAPFLSEDFKTAKMGRKSNEEIDYFDGIIDEFKIYKWLITIPKIDIEGPSMGKVGIKYGFIFTLSPPQGGWRVNIDWGDGTSETTGFNSSGYVMVNHTWTTEGIFIIKAWAKNEDGIETTVATHKIIIPRIRASSYQWYHWFLECFPFLEIFLHKIYLKN